MKETGTHHLYFRFVSAGKGRAIATYMSHSASEIDTYLQSAMAKQMHLPKVQFQLFVECSMDEKEYRDILLAKGIIAE